MDSVNPKWKRNPPSDTLFVKNLSFGTSEDTSYHLFDGDSNIRIVTDQESGESRGFGYIEYSETDTERETFPEDDRKVRNVEVQYKYFPVDDKSKKYKGKAYTTVQLPVLKLVVILPVECFVLL